MVGFCLSTLRHHGASSTRQSRFPGAKGTRLHSFNNVTDEFTGSEPSWLYIASVVYYRRKFIHPELLT